MYWLKTFFFNFLAKIASPLSPKGDYLDNEVPGMHKGNISYLSIKNTFAFSTVLSNAINCMHAYVPLFIYYSVKK